MVHERVCVRARTYTKAIRRSSGCDLTVVVPTRNESANIGPLLDRLGAVRPELGLEVVFVDDSSDDTPRVIGLEAKRSARPVSLIHRRHGERSGGLGGAVQAGLLAAESEFVCVMDADLQHPPEILEALVDEARRSKADVVVASRYCDHGDVGDFSAVRVGLSRVSAIAAKVLFPRRLRTVSDPMSGFFLVRRSAVDVAALRPKGFKVLLEILLSAALTTSEVPFRFGDRHAGESKASVSEGARYLRRLLELRLQGRSSRLGGFAAVGALGIGLNTTMLALLTRDAHLWYLGASALATQVAIVSNYALTEWLVFRGVKASKSLRVRLGSYLLINNVSLVVSGPLLVLLVSVGVGLLMANVLSLLLLVTVRFAVADSYIWGPKSLRLRRLETSSG